MKKLNWKLIIVISLLVAVYITVRATGLMQFYTTPSQSMAPTLKAGARFAVSNLKKPKRNDVIAFTRILTEKDGFDEPGKRLTFTSRLIAFGGETVEIKNGLAYVDGNLTDDSTHLQFIYNATSESYNQLIDVLKIDPGNEEKIYEIGGGKTVLLTLTNEEYTIAKRITTLTKQEYEDGDLMLYQNDTIKKWTVSNYGPITIPPDSYFVLGDNRDASSDSRYNGPVSKKNLKGTFLFEY